MTPQDQQHPSALGPLTAAVFHILLALADGPKHGYAIMKQVADDAGTALRMGPGTLYGSLQRMTAIGLVEEREEDDERRRYYQLTTAGRGALNGELTRLKHALAAARRKRVPVLRTTGS